VIARRRIVAVVRWLACIVAVLTIWPATFGGWLSLTIVSGTSMQPTYHTGDMVVGWRTSNYRPGDIVVYTIPSGEVGEGYQIIHRLRSVDPDGAWTVRGDNRSAADPWHPRARDIVGEAVFVVPGAGNGLKFLPVVLALLAGVFVAVGLWPRRQRRHRLSTEAEEDIATAKDERLRIRAGRWIIAGMPAVLAAAAIAIVLVSHTILLGNAAGLGGIRVPGISSWVSDDHGGLPSSPPEQ
jgi:signal peptidase